MRQGQFAKVDPEWIARDISYKYRMTYIGRCSARPGRRPNHKPIDRIAISLRKAWRSAVQQALAVVVEQKDGCTNVAVGRGLDFQEIPVENGLKLVAAIFLRTDLFVEVVE